MKAITILVCFTIALSSCAAIDPASQEPIQIQTNSPQDYEPTAVPVPTPFVEIDGAGSGIPCEGNLAKVHEHHEEILNWQIYNDPNNVFHVHYPSGWRYEEFEGWVGFGPQEMQEDVQWGLHILEDGPDAIESAIAAIGNQFTPERAERRDYLVLNGLNALRVIVVTPLIEDWVNFSVFIQEGGKVYHFDNGAKPDDRFHYFFCSFRLTDSQRE